MPKFLPGTLRLSRGRLGDYDELAAYHYRAGRPATAAAVWTIRYEPRDLFTPRPVLGRRMGDESARPRAGGRIVAIGILSYPSLGCIARDRCLGRSHLSRRRNLRFANRHVRTISRVIVHPQFRAIGLGAALVRWICRNCDTRYVESLAAMGRAHPFFRRGGMRRVELSAEDLARRRRRRGRAKPPYVYFFLDRFRRRATRRKER